MGRMTGKAALITGAARGQGRAHAVRLAEEGADIVAVDLLGTIDTVGYSTPDSRDKDETIKLVHDRGRRILFEQGDVRDLARLEQITAKAVSELGHIDVVVANAGICTSSPSWDMAETMWQTLIDINLTGVWKTVRAAIPHMIAAGRGGSIIIISSIAGLGAFPNMVHYDAAKHGLVGLMRGLAVELGQFNIRVNTVHPTNVDTPMLQNYSIRELMTGNPAATEADVVPVMSAQHIFNVPWVDVEDVSNMVAWLASDEARYVTATTQVLDAGALAPFKLGHPDA
jgi:SDR family mycofactocin-dependent oxidoreductase